MVNAKFERIFSALVVPTAADESVSFDSLRRLVECELADGVEGFYCCGSSGEGLLLTLQERKAILECVLDAVAGRVPVISHIGTIRTADVISLARHAKAAGADAVSMIPPYYYKFSMEEIFGYYEDVIRAVPGLPMILYNIPNFTGVEFSKANASRLLDNPAVIGVKHTSTNLYSLERMHAAYPDKILFNGYDEQFLGALSMGATATVGTTVNCFAPLFLKVRELFKQGHMEEAQKVQNAINLRIEEMCRYGIFPAAKYMMTRKGVPCGSCRAPFAPLSEEAMAALDKLSEMPLET